MHEVMEKQEAIIHELLLCCVFCLYLHFSYPTFLSALYHSTEPTKASFNQNFLVMAEFNAFAYPLP